MPFEGDEIGHHSITYTATADSGETASASTTINVEDCSTTQQRNEVVVISGTENTVANAGDDNDNLAVIDRPTDSAIGRLQHAARGFAATFGDAPRDIVTSGNGYVVEVELSGEKAREIVNRVENTDGNAWTGHGNEIVINEHRVLAEGDILDGIDAQGADDVTVVFAVDHSNPQQVAKNVTGSVGPSGGGPDTSSKRDSEEGPDYSYGTRQSTNDPNSGVGYIAPSSDDGDDSNNQSKASESSNHLSGTGSGDSSVGYTAPESDSTSESASSSNDSNSEGSSDTPDPNNDTGYALPGI
ncbi:hypothetical protein [Natronomonas amylolytica]|uniref:hypothetical protein n=1 Tax=Natronomonas amylolytica TaxID=3108498 RepID=UPI003009F917